MNKQPKKGFTLIELLIASTVLIFVITGLSAILVTNIQLQNAQRGLADAQQNARIVTSLMTNNISRCGTGLLPRTVAVQRSSSADASNELLQINYVKAAATNATLEGKNLILGVMLQKYEAPIPKPDTTETTGGLQDAGSGVMKVMLTRPTGLRDTDNDGTKGPELGFDESNADGKGGLSALIYNSEAAAAQKSIADFYANAFILTKFDELAEEVNDVDSVRLVSTPPVSWEAGDGTGGAAANIMPVCVFPGVVHAVFALKDGKFYMAEFELRDNTESAPKQYGGFSEFADNIQSIQIIYRSNADAGASGEDNILESATIDQSGYSVNFVQGTQRMLDISEKVNLREVEIIINARTGQEVAVGSLGAEYKTQIVRISTKAHMPAFSLDRTPKKLKGVGVIETTLVPST